MTSLPFIIGYDHYRFRMGLSLDKYRNQCWEDLQHGYQAAALQGVSQVKPTLFDIKLLTILERSLVKNREVTITAQDIKKALQDVGKVCPITHQPFTFGENKDTDWSVDRIDNGLGYCPGNITITSRIANQAKSNLDLAGIIRQCFQPSADAHLLSEEEWFRLANFYYRQLSLQKTFSFCELLADDEVIIELLIGSALLMFLLQKDKQAKRLIAALATYIGTETVNAATRLLKKRYYKIKEYSENLFLDCPKLMLYLSVFRQIAVCQSSEFDPLLLDCLFVRRHP
jgi:hypothetical protein